MTLAHSVCEIVDMLNWRTQVPLSVFFSTPNNSKYKQKHEHKPTAAVNEKIHRWEHKQEI